MKIKAFVVIDTNVLGDDLLKDVFDNTEEKIINRSYFDDIEL